MIHFRIIAWGIKNLIYLTGWRYVLSNDIFAFHFTDLINLVISFATKNKLIAILICYKIIFFLHVKIESSQPFLHHCYLFFWFIFATSFYQTCQDSRFWQESNSFVERNKILAVNWQMIFGGFLPLHSLKYIFAFSNTKITQIDL